MRRQVDDLVAVQIAQRLLVDMLHHDVAQMEIAMFKLKDLLGDHEAQQDLLGQRQNLHRLEFAEQIANGHATVFHFDDRSFGLGGEQLADGRTTSNLARIARLIAIFVLFREELAIIDLLDLRRTGKVLRNYWG